MMEQEPRSLEPKLGRVKQDAAAFGEIAAELCRTVSSKKTIAILAGLIREHLHADHVLFMTPGEEQGRWHSLAAVGLDDDPERAQKFAYARLLAGWVNRTALPLVVRDPDSDARFEGPPLDLHHAVTEPLVGPEGPSGAVVLLFNQGTRSGEVAESDRQVLELATSILSLYRIRESYRERIQRLTDEAEQQEKESLELERTVSSAELIVGMSRELKSPIAGITAVIGQLAESLAPDDPRRSQLEVVTAETARLNRVVNDQIELGETSGARLDSHDLNRILGECLLLAAGDLRKRKVRVTKRLGSSLPLLLVEVDLMQRVFRNIIQAGIESASPGGRMKVQTKRTGSQIEVVIAADGDRGTGQALEKMWKPFGSGGSGTDDISVAGIERILSDHHGTLRVSSTPEWPLVFSLVLPIAGNQDRRQGFIERRNRKDRRRRA